MLTRKYDFTYKLIRAFLVLIFLFIFFLSAGCDSFSLFGEKEDSGYGLAEKKEDDKMNGPSVLNEEAGDDPLPPPGVYLEPDETLPGNHVIVKVGPFNKTPEINLKADFDHDLSASYREDDYIYFLLGVNYTNSPGNYNLTFDISKLNEESITINKSLLLNDPEFDFSSFSVPPTVFDEWTTEQLARDRERVREARAQTEEVHLWSGPFIWPVEGRISSDFGAVRVINNGPPRHHSGIDIALPEGTPFVAANRGVVTLAEFLLASGNAVFIDHGLGLSSNYLHMHEIFVEEGQLVEKGDVIGTIGTTGFSTGPHLHWSVYIGDTPVSPYEFLEGLIPVFPY